MAPRDIRPGEIYASAIIDAIESAKIFVLVLTEHSNISPQVQKEVDRAVNAKLKILALILRKVELSKALNYYLCDSHWIDCHDGREVAVAAVVQACRDQPAPVKVSRKKSKWWLMGLFLPLLLFLFAVLWHFLMRPVEKFSYPVRPLPQDSLGTWSERIGGRYQSYHAPQTMRSAPGIEHLYTQAELEKMTVPELDLLYNEIFARHGFIFEDPILRRHFEAQPWYVPIKGEGTIQELNDRIFMESHILDEDNRMNIQHHIEARMRNELLSSGRFTHPYLKIYPFLFFDIPPGRLTQEQSEFEKRSFDTAAFLAREMLMSHQIPSEYGPVNLEEISFKKPWKWYKKQTAPYLILIGFGQSKGDAIQIYHGSNPVSKEAAVKLAREINEVLRATKDIYPWKAKVQDEYAPLKRNDGISLYFDVGAPEAVTDMREYEHLSDILGDIMLNHILTELKKSSK